MTVFAAGIDASINVIHRAPGADRNNGGRTQWFERCATPRPRPVRDAATPGQEPDGVDVMKGGRYVGCCVLLMLSGAAGAAPGDTALQDAEADRVLTEKLNKDLARMKRLEGQSGLSLGRANIDLANCEIRVDLPGTYLPSKDSFDFQQQLLDIGTSLWWTSRKLDCEGNVRIFIDGKPSERHFPDSSFVRSDLMLHNRPLSDQLTVVAAGHGLYLNHQAGNWVYQRAASHGIIEDEVTPFLADELQRLIRERIDNHQVQRVRSTSSHIHEGSNRPWWMVAARYNLMELLPENTEIWNSLPNETAGDRERQEDIRSRPLFANHLGAGGLVHLHTNAYPADPSVRGARVYIHPDSMQNAPLAQSMLCYMREIINAQPGYETFPVAPNPHTGNHGENRLALMPAVVVEAAFHTNVDDALALQDPVFRTAAMKGVEKGYRLHRKGKGCAPLSLKPIADIAVASWSSEDVPLAFDGYPQYPVVAVTTAQSCPEGWECREGKTTQGDASWPIKATLRCENSNPGRIVWQTQLIDDDGVRSKPVTHAVDCGGAG